MVHLEMIFFLNQQSRTNAHRCLKSKNWNRINCLIRNHVGLLRQPSGVNGQRMKATFIIRPVTYCQQKANYKLDETIVSYNAVKFSAAYPYF